MRPERQLVSVDATVFMKEVFVAAAHDGAYRATAIVYDVRVKLPLISRATVTAVNFTIAVRQQR